MTAWISRPDRITAHKGTCGMRHPSLNRIPLRQILRHRYLPALAALVLLAAWTSAAAAASDWRAKVDPELLAAGAAPVDCMVLLRTQADLSAADALPSREAKLNFVYAQLKATAEAAQKP